MNKLNKLFSGPLLRSGLVLFSWGVFAKVFALVKETLLADKLGTGGDLDAFYLTILIPVFVANMFGSPIAQTIIPLVRGESAKTTYSHMHSFGRFLLLWVLAVFPFLFIVQWVYLNYWGLDFPAVLPHAIVLFPFVLVILSFQCVNSFLVAIAESKRRFAFTNFHSIWMSASLIAVLFFMPTYSGLLLGFSFSYVAFFVMLLWVLKDEIRKMLSADVSRHSMKASRKGYLYVALAGGLGGSAFFVDQLMAAEFQSGGISSLQYAFRLTTVFTGLGAMSVGNVLLPQFSSLLAKKSFRESWVLLKKTLLLVFVVGSVISSVLYFVAPSLVELLFEHGQFSRRDSLQVSAILLAYLWYIPVYVMYYVLVRFFSSTHQNGLLIFLSVFSLISNVTLNLLFIQIWGLPGIAISTVISGLMTLGYGWLLLWRAVSNEKLSQ